MPEEQDPKPTPRMNKGSVKPNVKPIKSVKTPVDYMGPEERVAFKNAQDNEDVKPLPEINVTPNTSNPIKPKAPRINLTGKSDPRVVTPSTAGTGFTAPQVPMTSQERALTTKAVTGAQKTFQEAIKPMSNEEVVARQNELEQIQGKDLESENIFIAAKNNENAVVFQGRKISNADELDEVLQDPSQRSQFFKEHTSVLRNYFNVQDETDFDNRLSGGLSLEERSKFGQSTLSIYDPIFNRKTMKPGDLGFKPEFGQFAPDPVSEQYQISQRRFSAQQDYAKIKDYGLATDVYGQPLDTAEEFYNYLADPVNRDAYQRKNKTKLKEAGFNGVNTLLEKAFLPGSDFGSIAARNRDSKNMRMSKGQALITQDMIGKSAVVFDEKETSSSIGELSDLDIGRMLWEYDLGNHIGYSIPDNKKGFTEITRDELVTRLQGQGLMEDEVQELLDNLKFKYNVSITAQDYEKKRTEFGYTVGKGGKNVSKFDELLESRAQGELSEIERKISTLYDQIESIYESAKPVKGKKQTVISDEQVKKVTALRSQIEQLKRESGFFGFNNIPTQEFFDSQGKRLEGKEQENAQQVFTKTLQGEQKTDKAILKEKRNVLYVKLDNLKKKYDETGGGKIDTSGFRVVLPKDYDPESLNAQYEEARSKDASYLLTLTKGLPAGFNETLLNDQQKANYIYRSRIREQILETSSQLKAMNKLIYTNADLTKIEAKGVFKNIKDFTFKTIGNLTGSNYLTPAEEVEYAADFLTSNGLYVNPEVTETLKGLQEDQLTAHGLINSFGIGLQLTMYGGRITGRMSDVFTGAQAVKLRSYMASRHGKTGLGAFRLFEKAATVYGKDYLSYEMAGLDGGEGVAEALGAQSYDKLTGILKLGKFIPNNIIGKMTAVLGRSISGATGSFVEESFANVWSVMKENGFDIRSAVEEAYGKTEDEQLMNMRMTAFSSIVFSSMNSSNLALLFATRKKFAGYLESLKSEPSAVDKHILDLLDETIKNAGGDDNYNAPGVNVEPELAVATASPRRHSFNRTLQPFTNPVMTSGPVPDDQKTTTSSDASSGAGSEGVKVEKRTGNMGEEFYVAEEQGVVDNKVVYRYNSENGQLEARGLTSTSEDFVAVGEKTREFIEQQSQENGIVSRQSVENIAKERAGETTESMDKEKVLYQNNTETSRRKKERISKVQSSAKTRFKPKFEQDATVRLKLFTGIATEVEVDDDQVKEATSEMSKKFGTKMKINLISFFQDGKAVVTNLARNKAAKVADYVAPLFKDFDNTFFDKVLPEESSDPNARRTPNTAAPGDFDNSMVLERKKGVVVDKVREAVARNTLFNEVFGDMISEGRMSEEDAIDNFIINLLQNDHSKVKEIFGNDKAGLESFSEMRKAFNNFVAVKYTGAATFNTTNKFVRNTPMSTSTAKHRKQDLKRQASELAEINRKRQEVAYILQNTQEEGVFVTGDQVDAVRLLENEITPQDFLENAGVNTSGMTVDQMQAEADSKARSLIDYEKYQKGALLQKENNTVREQVTKDLLKEGKETFQFHAFAKAPLKWRKNLRQKRAFAEVATRQFESQATRAGIPLKQFMDTRIQFLKRTEEQFQEWLKMSPNLVPLYQNAGNLNAEHIYPNVNKAKELRTKNYSPEKIRVMTGVVLNENGDAIAFDPSFKVNTTEQTKTIGGSGSAFLMSTFFNKKGAGHETNLFQGIKVALEKLTQIYNETPKGSVILTTFGTQSRSDVSTVYSITSLFKVGENQELYNLYPDLGLVQVRLVDNPNLPAVSFHPNYLYESGGDAKTANKPGEVVINLQKYKIYTTRDINTLDQNYQTLFDKNILPQIQQSIRQAAQHIEGELPKSEIKFATPTAVRAKLLELRSKKVIDENTEKLVNDIVDFYIDKNVFQFGSYKSVFADIAKVLFGARSETAVNKVVENFAYMYGLTTSDAEALESIYNNYMNSYNQGDSVEHKSKSLHNAFLVSKSLAGLNNEQLILAGSTELQFTRDRAADPANQLLKLNAVDVAKTKAEQQKAFEGQQFKEILNQIDPKQNYSTHLEDVFEGEKMIYGSEAGNKDLQKGLALLAELHMKLKEYSSQFWALRADRVITPQEILELENLSNDPLLHQAVRFLNEINPDTTIIMDNGVERPVFYDFDEFEYHMDNQTTTIDDLFAFDVVLTNTIDTLKQSQKAYMVNSVISEVKDITDAEAKKSFYEMFPGIDKYMEGIYDPYKPITDFTKEELQTQLVDSGLVSQKKFDEVYAGYKSNPEMYSGSVASNFIDTVDTLTPQEQQRLSEILKTQQLVEDSFSTAFYSNAAYATAKVIAQAGKKGTIIKESLKSLLMKNGAKQVELDWLGFDDFISQYDTVIPQSDLISWAENIPQFVSYDPENSAQVKEIEKVIYFGGNQNYMIINDLLKEAFKDNETVTTGSNVDPNRPVSEMFAVKRSDGTVRFVDLTEISEETLSLYESYIDSPEKYSEMKDVIEKLIEFRTTGITDENIENVKTLIQLHFEATDELERQRRAEKYRMYAAVFSESVPASYREHTFSFPFSSNKLLKSYDDAILDMLEQMSELARDTKKQSENKQKIQDLQDQITKLSDQKGALRKDYFNTAHFTSMPGEVVFSMRTQLVIGENGERMLQVIEIQSDKVQNFRKDVLDPIKKKFPVDRTIEEKIAELEKDKSITKEDIKKEVLNLQVGFTQKKLTRNVNNYFKRKDATQEAKEKFKKTSSITQSEQFVDIAIKHALKIASDSGVKKIVFSNGATIGMAVNVQGESNTQAGLNKMYNQTIPSRAKKLAKTFGFTDGTTKLSVQTYIDTSPAKKPSDVKFKLDKNTYPIYFNKEGKEVKNTGKELTVDKVSSDFLDKVGLETTGNMFVPGNEFFSIELTDQTLSKVAEGMALYQQNEAGAHGAMVKTDTGKHIVFALTKPTIATAMHELAHVWESNLTATEKQMFLDEVGHDTWTRETSEAFARGFENYLAQGKAPSASTLKLFDNFKKWFRQIYGAIKGSPIEMEISEPMRRIYDGILGEAKVNPLEVQKTPDVIDDINTFIKELKANPEFDGLTDDETYAALMRSGFDPTDVQEYFALKERANIEKQQQRQGVFKQEADFLADEEEAMRVVRDQKALVEEIENLDSIEYPIILQTLYDVLEDADVPLAKAIFDLIKAKHEGGDPATIAADYSRILKAGTSIGRMLSLFRQLTTDSYLTGAEAMFRRNESKGVNVPEQSKQKIRELAVELDKIKTEYKNSRALALSDPFGTSASDPSKTNLQYHTDLYDKMQQASKNYVDARLPFEGDSSLTDMYRSFVKGGLMTPGSMSVNTLSNATKFLIDIFTNPLKSGISFAAYKLGVTEKQYTKSSLRDFMTGTKFLFTTGVPRGFKILKDGTMTQTYQTPEAYAQGYSFIKAMTKFTGLMIDKYRIAAGTLSMTQEELAEKHGFKVNDIGEIPSKEVAIAGLQATFGIVPDIVFRIMGATDAVFRDYAYFSAVSEQFKLTKEYDLYLRAIENAPDKVQKEKLKAELEAVRDAYLKINSDYQNTEANKDAMRFVYTNDNATTELVSKIQGMTREKAGERLSNSVLAKLTRLAGTGIVPFTRIPSNYAAEIMEFFIPEYALMHLAWKGYKSYDRASRISKGELAASDDTAAARRDDARDMDRMLARALVGTGIQMLALEFVKAGAVSGGADDENPEDKKKSMGYTYTFERPYSVNLTLAKERLKEKMIPGYVSPRKNNLWDKEQDLIKDYRALGMFGAGLYFQYKENLAGKTNRFVNRGVFEQSVEEFNLSLFGKSSSAYSYIIDQTFVKGILSVAKAITEEDDNKLPTFLADMTVTLASGIMPNTVSWMDKWRRQFAVDYDSRDSEEFKAFGLKIQDPFATSYWTKLATKLAERWPVGKPESYVDLPLVESERDNLPIRVDPFGKPVLQTPKGATMGAWMYNTFDVFKSTRAYAGYETPDWESLCYLATKLGGAWETIPTPFPRKVDTPSGSYKFAPEEYANLLQYNGQLKRDFVDEILVRNKVYKELLDVNSKYNQDKNGKPILGRSNNKILHGYEILSDLLQVAYRISDNLTKLATNTFIDAEREKLYNEDPDRYMEMYKTEVLSPLGEFQKKMYGGQETGVENFTDRIQAFRFDFSVIEDPERFKKKGRHVMKEMLEFNNNPKTAIITGKNETSFPTRDASGLGLPDGVRLSPLIRQPDPKSKASEVLQQKEQTGSGSYLPPGVVPVR